MRCSKLSMSVLVASVLVTNGAIAASDIKAWEDFEGTMGPVLGNDYRCDGTFDYVPSDAEPGTQALRIQLPFSPESKCGTLAGDTIRSEAAETKAERVPLGEDDWYSFKFKLPAGMKGKIGNHRFVVAQLKQHESGCQRSPHGMELFELKDGNPTLSVRIAEDLKGGVVGVSLSVSTVYLTKVQTGVVMRQSDAFFDAWHTLKLHARFVPRAEGAPVPQEPGAIEGWLDGQRFGDVYGTTSGEPYGYPTKKGCTYFKFGIYADVPEGETWTVLIDRFRRGNSDADVH